MWNAVSMCIALYWWRRNLPLRSANPAVYTLGLAPPAMHAQPVKPSRTLEMPSHRPLAAAARTYRGYPATEPRVERRAKISDLGEIQVLLSAVQLYGIDGKL